MTTTAQQQRTEAFERIVYNPQNYKICEGCTSIVTAATELCPACHSFRFNHDETDVGLHAIELHMRNATSVIVLDR